MTIGERIKQRRLEMGLSVDDLAKKLGKNRATIYRYESNDIENFPTTTLEPLAKVLNTTPAYLMGWEDEQDPSFSFYLDMQLSLLGFSILYDSEGNVTLFQGKDAYEITDTDVKDLRESVLSYIKFKLQELTNRVRQYPPLHTKAVDFSDYSHLEPQAAHERTDIDVTDEMRKHDDDIMDNDEFWK